MMDLRERFRKRKNDPEKKETPETTKKRTKKRTQFLATARGMRAGKVLDLIFHESVLSKQNGFYYVRPDNQFIFECMRAPNVTLVDLRSCKDYRQIHLRTAINVAADYLFLPDQCHMEHIEQAYSAPPDEQCSNYFENFTKYINEDAIKNNRDCFIRVEDLMQHSFRLNTCLPHRLVIYDDCSRAKRSMLLAKVIHVLHCIYGTFIQDEMLEIFVLKWGFDRLKSERTLDPILIASTNAFRKSATYEEMDSTDDDVLTQVLPYLYLSSSIGATNLKLLKQEGITVVVNLTEKEIKYPPLEDLTIVHAPMVDYRHQSIIQPIERINALINEAKETNGKVLVHCTRGQSRSPIVALGYLMYSRGWSILKSFLYVREKRPWIGPNPSFMSQLMLYETQLSNCFSTQYFPLHAYTLLESRDEDFDENLRVLDLCVDEAEPLFSALHSGSINEAIRIVKAEPHLKYGRKCGAEDQTPIHCALELCSRVPHKKIMSFLTLVTDQITVNRDTMFGETPLHIAARDCELALVMFLLSRGADVTAKSLSGKNALHLVARSSSSVTEAVAVPVINELLQFCTDANRVICFDVYGITPIDYAERANSMQISRALRTRQLQELFLAADVNHRGTLNLSEVAFVILDMIRANTCKSLYSMYFAQLKGGEGSPSFSYDKFVSFFLDHSVDSSIAKFLKNEENLQKIKEQQRAAKREAEEKAREQQKEKEKQQANPLVVPIPLRSSVSSYTPSPELVEIISKNSGTDAASTFSDDSTSDDQPKHNYLSERKRRRKDYGEPSSETEPSSNNGDEEEPFDDEEEDELVDVNQNNNKTKDSDTTSHFSDGMSMSSSREDEDESERVMKILYKLTKEKLFHHSEIYNEICQRLQKSWDFDEAISFRQLRKLLLNLLVDNAESIGGYLLKCFPPEFDDSSSVELVQSTGHSLSLLLDSCRCLTHSTDATALSFVEDFSDDEPS